MHDIQAQDGYSISTDRHKLDMDMIHHFLTHSYWAPGISLERVKRAAEHSLCFGVYHHDKQVGYARVLSDFAVFAYLMDVFIVDEHRGRGLGKWLIQTILEYPDLGSVKRWLLATKDAHGLYAQFGFEPISHPERFMGKSNFESYAENS